MLVLVFTNIFIIHVLILQLQLVSHLTIMKEIKKVTLIILQSNDGFVFQIDNNSWFKTVKDLTWIFSFI